MPEGAACPDRAELEEFAASDEGNPQLESHLASCSACRALLERLNQENALLTEVVGANIDRISSASEGEIPQTVTGYRLLREIHRGGQGVIWLAEQEGTRRRVALKMLLQGVLPQVGSADDSNAKSR